MQFVAIANKISSCFHFHQSALVLINVMIEVISPLIVTQEINKQKHINQYVISIIRNLKIEREKLIDVKYFMIVTKIICNITTNVSRDRLYTEEEIIIMKITTDKALELIEYVLIGSKLATIYYEIFCNFLYQILTRGSSASKKRILNYIFKLKGHRFFLGMINECDNETVAFKFKLVFSKIISQLVQFLQKENNVDESSFKYLDMILKSHSDVKYLKMIKIFAMYIDLKWQPWTQSKKTVVSVGSVLNYFYDHKLMFDDGIRYFLLSSFIECFEISSIAGDRSLMKASKIVEKFGASIKLEVEMNFVKWWLFEHLNKKNEREKLLLKFVSQNNSRFDHLDNSDAAIFVDTGKLLMKNFLDKSQNKILRQNLLKFIAHSQLSVEDVQGLLKYFQKLIARDTSNETIYIIAALKSNANQLHHRVCKTTASFIDILMNKEFKAVEIRAAAIDLAFVLIHQMNK